LTGLASSYPAKTAIEINARIDAMGMDAVETEFVKPWMMKAVNDTMAEVARRIRRRRRS
jgi:hypothetical protein